MSERFSAREPGGPAPAQGAVLETACRCGQVALRLAVPGRRSATRVVCYCDDCQTAAGVFGATAFLGKGSGTDLVQSTPDRLTILRGADTLAVLRLSPRGLYRWYAACCDTPMCNTLPNLGLPFVGLVLAQGSAAQERAQALLGPPAARVFTTTARPRAEAPRQDQGFARAGWGVLSRMIVAGLSGRGRLSPLRDSTGAPIGPVRVLSKEERHDARPG